MLRFAVSSWSLHRLLGEPRYELADPAGDALVKTHGEGDASLSLLEVPAVAAAQGIRTLELVHFHLPSLDAGYLRELRGAMDAAGVELFSVLIDVGDIVHPDEAKRARDIVTIRRWIEVAAVLGAGGVRIDAGRQPPTSDVVEMSAAGLRALAGYAASLGVGAFTENWHATSREPGPLLEILDRCEGEVGLCVDWGNAAGPGKAETLRRLMPRGTSIHAKAERCADGEIDREDLRRWVSLLTQHDFAGPVSLIHSEVHDDWRGIRKLREGIEACLTSSPPRPS